MQGEGHTVCLLGSSCKTAAASWCPYVFPFRHGNPLGGDAIVFAARCAPGGSVRQLKERRTRGRCSVTCMIRPITELQSVSSRIRRVMMQAASGMTRRVMICLFQCQPLFQTVLNIEWLLWYPLNVLQTALYRRRIVISLYLYYCFHIILILLSCHFVYSVPQYFHTKNKKKCGDWTSLPNTP